MDQVDFDKSDSDFVLNRNIRYFDSDAFGFGINRDTNEIELTNMGDNHMYLFRITDKGPKISKKNRQSLLLPGRIWLDSKIISYYGTPSSSELKENINKILETLIKLFEYINNGGEIIAGSEFSGFFRKRIMVKLKSCIRTKFSDFFLEINYKHKYENGHEEDRSYFKNVINYINDNKIGKNATKSEMEQEHTKSPMLKKTRTVHKGFGSKKSKTFREKAKELGIPISEMNYLHHVKQKK